MPKKSKTTAKAKPAPAVKDIAGEESPVEEPVIPNLDAKPEAGPSALELLTQKVEELTNRLEAAEDESATYRQTVEEMSEIIQERQELGDEDLEPDAAVVNDPYYSKNPYAIVGEIEPSGQFVEGQVLSWKNAKHRNERRGWRGWIPLEYGDEYAGEEGELLTQYIPDPPPRLEGSTKVDNYVRRADLVLCRIDKRIFEARQRQRELLSNRGSLSAGSSKTSVLREGVEITGPGLKNQKRPKSGFRMGKEKAVVGAHHQHYPVLED